MTDLIKIAIVAENFTSKLHFDAYKNIKNVKVVAFVDISPNKVYDSKYKDINIYNNLQELFENEQVDLVAVCTPLYLHSQYCIYAMKAGCHVICEKPFTTTEAEMDLMIKTSSETGKKLMISRIYHFMGEYKILKTYIEDELLGKPLFYSAFRTSTTNLELYKNYPLDVKIEEINIMDLQSQDIDITNWLLGTPISINKSEAFNKEKSLNSFSHITTMLKYENDVGAVLQVGYSMPGSYPNSLGFNMVFENGVLEFVKSGDFLTFSEYSNNQKKDLSEGFLKNYENINPYTEELKYFIECIYNKTDYIININQIKNTMNSVLNSL